MVLNLEAATEGDYEDIVEVYSELVELHVENLPWKYQRPEKEIFSKAVFMENLKSKNSLILLAKQKVKVIGLINVKIEKAANLPLNVARRYAKIHDLVVKESFREKGVGKKLLDEAQKWVQSKGVTDIELEVYDFNEEAMAFYKKDGFREVSHIVRKVLKGR
jgi:ribosomal protein S18 acetylase RimI-like enzyme